MDKGNTLISGLDPDIELLVKRTGSLQFTEHGQLKFFGTTSNVHFLRTAIPFQPHSRISADVNSPEAWLECSGVGHPVPRELEDHLIKLYFNWENPYFRVVDEDAFMDARRQALSSSSAEDGSSLSCYSEFLVNAMCVFSIYTPGELSHLILSIGVLGERFLLIERFLGFPVPCKIFLFHVQERCWSATSTTPLSQPCKDWR